MNRVITFLSLVGLALLSACSSDSGSEGAEATAAALAAAPAGSAKTASGDPVARMARAVGDGKPGAAVTIKYEFLGKPAVGAPTEVQVAFVPNAGVDALDAAMSGMDGITLAGVLTANFTDVQAGKAYTHTFSLLPNRSGVFYITVSVNTQIGGSTLGRTFSIPFSVGNPAVQKKAAPVKDAAGEAIQPMQAEETTD